MSVASTYHTMKPCLSVAIVVFAVALAHGNADISYVDGVYVNASTYYDKYGGLNVFWVVTPEHLVNSVRPELLSSKKGLTVATDVLREPSGSVCFSTSDPYDSYELVLRIRLTNSRKLTHKLAVPGNRIDLSK